MSRQASILSFAVEKPRYVAPHRPSLPVKRILKRRPGRPRKKVRVDDWREQWYKAVENEQCHIIEIFGAYEEACGSHYANRAPACPISGNHTRW